MGEQHTHTHSNTMMAYNTNTCNNQSNLERKLARKQRAASKAASKEMKMAHKGKPSKRANRLQEQAQANVQQLQQQQGAVTHERKRSDKLERQLQSLMQKDAQSQTLLAKADELQKAQWREIRRADFGHASARSNRRS